MTINERLRLFVKKIGVSERQFAINTGLSQGALGRSNSLNGEGLALIKRQYPELNMHWVFFGEGQMFMTPEMIKEQSGESKSPFTIDSLVDSKIESKLDKILNEKFADIKKLIREMILSEMEEELESAKQALNKKTK